MARTKQHRILVCSDGSPSAQAALTTAVRFPWKPSAQARGLVASFPWLRTESRSAQAALESSIEAAAASASRTLKARWPRAEVAVVKAPPADAILSEAQKFRASVVAVGWRGHGVFRRVLAGSVSRTVASRARCSVLVAREAPKAVRRVVLGYDGCPNANRALELLSSLEVPRGGSVLLVHAVTPHVLPASVSRLPLETRRALRQEIRSMNGERCAQAQAVLDRAAVRLRRAGWEVRTEVHETAAVAALLSSADDHRADIVVVGARARSGLERMLLGSVANAMLNRSRVPVLLVR